jgi:cell division protease FtsH
MSDKLGPLSYGAKEEEIFLGREIQRHRDYSEKTAIDIDDEIREIVNSCMGRAEKILKENIDVLHKLSKELLEREILDSEEIDKLIRGEELPPLKKEGNDISDNPDALPDHVKKLMEQRKPKEFTPKDDTNRA